MGLHPCRCSRRGPRRRRAAVPSWVHAWVAGELRRALQLAAARTDVRLGGPPWPASPAFQASFNEQIKHIIRKLHAEFFVQPQQQQDKSLCGTIEQQMIFARPIDQIPDFDRPVVRSRHNLGPVRGERHRPDPVAVGVRLLAQQPQRGCQTSQQASVLDKEGRF